MRKTTFLNKPETHSRSLAVTHFGREPSAGVKLSLQDIGDGIAPNPIKLTERRAVSRSLAPRRSGLQRLRRSGDTKLRLLKTTPKFRNKQDFVTSSRPRQLEQAPCGGLTQATVTTPYYDLVASSLSNFEPGGCLDDTELAATVLRLWTDKWPV